MTGNLLLLPPGWEIDSCLRERDPAAWNTRGPSFYRVSEYGDADEIDPVHLRYCRVCFDLADGRRLLYTDPRKFGRIELWARQRETEALAGLGMEPLGDEFTVERLVGSLAGRKGAIKQVLLDQTVIAGLGNIYADEALFYAAIHPLRPAHSLSEDEIRLLHEGIVSTLTLGIEHGGTSFSEYRDLWGEAGENYDHVRVYQQNGKPCALRHTYRAHSCRAARHPLLPELPEAQCGVKKAWQRSVPPGKLVKVTSMVAGIFTGCCPCSWSVNMT